MTETTRDPNPKPKRVKILFFACLYNLKILWVKQTQRARKKSSRRVSDGRNVQPSEIIGARPRESQESRGGLALRPRTNGI